jgi:hypothetical protein
MGLHLREHPGEREVGEPGLVVPAADIGMHSGKPDLFDPFAGIPQSRRETFPFFIDRQGRDTRTAHSDVRRCRRIETTGGPAGLNSENGNPERSNRIPHTDHFNRHILTPIILPKLSRHRSTVATVHVEGMTRTGVVETGRSWNPAPRQHPPKAPGCEGTPAESKQVQAITGLHIVRSRIDNNRAA